MMKHLFAAAVLAALCSPAFAQRTPADEPGTRLANPPAAGLSEREVVGMLQTVNKGELEAAQMAVERSTNEQVIAYARRMIADHEENNRKLETVGVRPARGEFTNKMERKHKSLSNRLGRLEGANFDRAYMNAMIEDHEMVIDKLDKKMIPAAKTGALSSHLTETRSAVESHLEEARRIKSSLGTR